MFKRRFTPDSPAKSLTWKTLFKGPWSFGLALMACFVVASPAAADNFLPCGPGTNQPCQFQIEATRLQPVPVTFKFQARISQAKFPVGEAEFSSLIVNLVRGNETLCIEEFNNVIVKDSVLNLEIGRTISCELGDILSQYTGLAFQICIGGTENCLKPIELGTVPYAVKANFALQSQEAHTAETAITSHYAHRTSADRDLFTNQELGHGYFDFYTHDTASADTTLNPAGYTAHTPYANDGYIQWTQVSSQSPSRLNICAKDLLTDQPQLLEDLVLHSANTTTRGHLNVQKNTDMDGYAIIHGGAVTEDGEALLVKGNSKVTGDVKINGHTEVDQSLTVSQGALLMHGVDDHIAVDAEKIVLQHGETPAEGQPDTNIRVTLNDTGTHIRGNATVSGDGPVALNVDDGALWSLDGSFLSGLTQVGDGGSNDSLLVVAPSTFDGESTFNKPATFESTALFKTAVQIGDSSADTLTVNSESSFGHNVDISGDATISGSLVSNQGVQFGTQNDRNTKEFISYNSNKFLGNFYVDQGSADIHSPTTFHEKVEFDQEVTFTGNVNIPADKIVTQIQHGNLNLTNASCPTNHIQVGLNTDASPICTASPIISTKLTIGTEAPTTAVSAADLIISDTDFATLGLSAGNPGAVDFLVYSQYSATIDLNNRAVLETTGEYPIEFRTNSLTRMALLDTGLLQAYYGLNVYQDFNVFGATKLWTDAEISGELSLTGPTGSLKLTDSSAKLGVRTSDPEVALHIRSWTDASLDGGGAAIFGATTSDHLVLDNNEVMARSWDSATSAFETSTLYLQNDGGQVTIHGNEANSKKVVINSDGEVGIGTSAPTEKLHVVGDVKIDGNLEVTSGLSCTTVQEIEACEASQSCTISASCAAGYKATGGGAWLNSTTGTCSTSTQWNTGYGSASDYKIQSYPLNTTQWRGIFRNNSGSAACMSVRVVCCKF